MAREVARLDDLPDGGKLVVPIGGGEELLLSRRGDEVFAIDNACPHEGGPLGEGEIRDGVVYCPWHEWSFELESGRCLNMPGCDAPSFQVTVREGVIFLEES